MVAMVGMVEMMKTATTSQPCNSVPGTVLITLHGLPLSIEADCGPCCRRSSVLVVSL